MGAWHGSCSPKEAMALHDRRGKVLVVDDDPEVGAALVKLLSARGFEVAAAADAAGARAVAAASPGCISVLVSDLVLAHGNGIEVAGEVRRTSPAARVVLTSGLVQDASDLSHLIDDGMEFVAQSFGTDGLVAAVERAARLH